MQIRFRKTPLYYIIVGLILTLLIVSEASRIGVANSIYFMAGLATTAGLYAIWKR